MRESRLAGSVISTTTMWGRAYHVCKRVMDVVLALSALVLAAPLLALVALWIKLDSRGPVLFRQTRLGKFGRPFTCFKFRTMKHDADVEVHRRYVQALIRGQTTSGEELGEVPASKLEGDVRVTRAGRFLRRTSLDELPQLLNVLRGDMSLVGPRPPLPYEVQAYQEWHMARLEAVPGVTGWWQVYGRSRVSFDEMVRMDLTYIEHQSLWLDVKLLLQTIPAVISTRGAK